jgi:hypothetical protein
MLDQHKNYAIFIYLSTRICIHFFQFAANSLEYVCVCLSRYLHKNQVNLFNDEKERASAFL